MGRSNQEQVALVGEKRAPEIVSVELNLEEPPIFGGRVKVGENGYQEYVQEYRKPDGGVGQRIWRWKAPDEYGELTVFDGDVYLAMHALANEKLGGVPEDGRIPFTLYEVLAIMGLKDNGRNYHRVRESILKINKTLMDAIDAFYRKDKKSYGSAHFIPWRVEFELNEDRYGRATERHILRFDEILVRSHMHGHLKVLDVNFCLSLRGAYAKSLYKRIDYKRGTGLVWSEDLLVLREHLGMPTSYRQPSRIKEKLQPSHEELHERGFVKSVAYEGRRVRYEVAPEFVAARDHLDTSWGHEESAAYRALLRNGVWTHIARELVQEQGPDVCHFYVDVLPYQKHVRDSGAWLAKFIKEQLPLPKEPPQRRLADADADKGSSHAGKGAPTRPHETEVPEVEADPEAEQVWQGVLGELNAKMDGSFRVWFDSIFACGLENRLLTLAAPNAFAKTYIEDRFGTMAGEVLNERLGADARLRVIVADRRGGR